MANGEVNCWRAIFSAGRDHFGEEIKCTCCQDTAKNSAKIAIKWRKSAGLSNDEMAFIIT